MDFSPLIISLKTALVATIITFFLGIYAAGAVMKMKRCKGLVDGFFTLPMVLPPTVVGFFLLLLLGKNSVVGKCLAYFEVSVVFSWTATVIAATVVAFPLMYRTTRGAFEQIDPNMIYAARTLGLTEREIFWKIILPVAWPGVAAGTILSFARALGEFGATIMIAGNIPGRTQTLSTAIYTAVQAGNRQIAFQWVMVIMVISFMAMMLLNYWTKYEKKTMTKHHWQEKG